MKQFGFIPVLMVILIALGVGGYLIYQKSQAPKIIPPEDQVVCIQDVKLCPDGTSVGRSGPKCEFSPCPSPKESTSSGDVSNWKTYQNTTFICPKSEYVDCMPKVDETTPSPDPRCNQTYLKWAKNNCPDFKGALY